MSQLNDLFTPSLVLDRTKLERNIKRMSAHINALGVDLRPHVKTSKSAEVSRLAAAAHSGAITVSTLEEARYFADAGFKDILYAVGIVPSKLPQVVALQEKSVTIKVVLDDLANAHEVANWAADNGCMISVLIEIDSDGQRAGLDPDDGDIDAIARLLNDAVSTRFMGLMTHAGESYNCRTEDELRAMAKQERDAVVMVAKRLADAGVPCPIVSVGSTPTALFAENLDGITEVRAGIYTFMDLYQEGLGCCALDDIALSVLTSVIGHKMKQNWMLVDAGGLALSKDHGRAPAADDRGYGLVMSGDGKTVYDNLIVKGVNQEHGMIMTVDGRPIDFSAFPIGARLRILPNHACMTAAAYDRYHVVDGGEDVVAEWSRTNGW